MNTGTIAVNTPDDFGLALNNGGGGGLVQVIGLVGRVLRGQAPSHFITLTDVPDKRRVIQLTDGLGLGELIGKTTTRDKLLHIGYDPQYIDDLKGKGTSYKLVVFPEEGTARRANWLEQLKVCADAWPEMSAILTHPMLLTQMRLHSFYHWDGECKIATGGKGIKEICADENHPLMKLAMTDQLSRSTTPSPLLVRIWLYKFPQLVELFSGDGYTWGADGRRGLPEYSMANREITKIPGAKVFDLPAVI